MDTLSGLLRDTIYAYELIVRSNLRSSTRSFSRFSAVMGSSIPYRFYGEVLL